MPTREVFSPAQRTALLTIPADTPERDLTRYYTLRDDDRGIPAKNRTIQNGKVAMPEERPLTPRSAVWQVLQRPEKRDEVTDKRLEKLRQAHTELDEAIALT